MGTWFGYRAAAVLLGGFLSAVLIGGCGTQTEEATPPAGDISAAPGAAKAPGTSGARTAAKAPPVGPLKQARYLAGRNAAAAPAK